MAVSQIALRNAWFQVHKWIGLLLAIAIIPIALTGAALVWHDALDEALHPQRHAITAGVPAQAPEALVAAASAVLAPGERVSNIRFEPEGPAVITAAQPPQPGASGRPVRTMVWLDPGTGRVLDKSDSSQGLVRFMHQLHGSLLIPDVGRKVVGWIGVAMLLSSATGLWLWWPTVGRWTRGLRWRRHRNLDTNLHHQLGFWIALPLFVLSLTGAWISFPAFFASLSGEQSQRGPGGDPGARFRARPLEAPAQDLAGAIATARAQASGELVSVGWPTDQKAEWTVAFKQGERPPLEVKIDDATGAGKVEPAKPEDLARTMRKIHDGTDMGLVWQVIIFLGGILPAVLAVTGIIMWWRARGWRAEVGERRNGVALRAG